MKRQHDTTETPCKKYKDTHTNTPVEDASQKYQKQIAAMRLNRELRWRMYRAGYDTGKK